MAFTYALDPTTPSGGEAAALGDDRIREFKNAMIERLQQLVSDYTTDPYKLKSGLEAAGTLNVRALTPVADNTYAIGTSLLRFSDLRSVTATFSSNITQSAGTAALQATTVTTVTASGLVTANASVSVTGAVSIDNSSTPATTGVVRIGYNTFIFSRNQANSGNRLVIGYQTSGGVTDTLALGDSGTNGIVPGSGDFGGNLGVLSSADDTGGWRWNDIAAKRIVLGGAGLNNAVTLNWALAIENFTKATAGVPVQWSSALEYRANLWDTTRVESRSHFWMINLKGTSGATTDSYIAFTWGNYDPDGAPPAIAGDTDLYKFNSSGLFNAKAVEAVTTLTAPTVRAGSSGNVDLNLNGSGASGYVYIKTNATSRIIVGTAEVTFDLPITVSIGTTALQAVTATTINTTSTINSQTISAAANFTGTLAVASTINSQTISATANFTGTLTVASNITQTAGTAALQALTATTGTFSDAVVVTLASTNQFRVRYDSTNFFTVSVDNSAIATLTTQGAGTIGAVGIGGGAGVVVLAGTSGGARALAFFGGAVAVKQTVTGSRGGNAALASLLSALAAHSLITDSSSA